jgi:hypothetical protein
MKTIFKISVIVGTLLGMLIIDIPVLPVHLVPDADAIFGVRRRAWRRGMVVGYTAGEASAEAAMSSHQSATAQQQSATAQQQSATAQQQSATAQQQSAAAQHPAAAAAAPPAPSGGGTLPLGTVVSSLPPGCVSTPYKDVEYYRCGDNYYRAMFQGNNLVYVTAKP